MDEWIMTRNGILQQYELLSGEDQRKLDRWLEGNAVLGLILAAGLVAMALAGAVSPAPHASVMNDGTKAFGEPAAEQGAQRIHRDVSRVSR